MQTCLGARNGIKVNKLQTSVALRYGGQRSGGTSTFRILTDSSPLSSFQSWLSLALTLLRVRWEGDSWEEERGWLSRWALMGAYKSDLSLLALSFMPAYSCKEASVFSVGSSNHVCVCGDTYLLVVFVHLLLLSLREEGLKSVSFNCQSDSQFH